MPSMWIFLACMPLGGGDSLADSADSGAPGDSGPGGDSPCGVTVTSTVPRDGAVDHYWRDPVSFTLSAADPTAVVTGPVVGSSSVSGRVVTFTPADAWNPSTDYELELSGCFGAATLGFRTSAYGTPLTVSLEGRVYLLDLQGATVTEPSNVAELLPGYIPGNLLMEVTTVSGPNLGLRLGGATAGASPPEQSRAVGTVDVFADATGSPYFEVNNELASVAVHTTRVDLSAVAISGTFAADGADIGELRLSALVDTRGLVPLVGDDAPDDEVCTLLAGLDVNCVDCPGGEPYCATFSFADVSAVAVDGVTVQPVEPEPGAACSVASGGLSALLVALGIVGRRQRRRDGGRA